jgi:hypothetical protein
VPFLLLEIVWWRIGYSVARLVLPLVSFGKLEVLPLESPDSSWLGYRRNGSGYVEIDPTPAGGIGLVICCIGLAIVLHFIP